MQCRTVQVSEWVPNRTLINWFVCLSTQQQQQHQLTYLWASYTHIMHMIHVLHKTEHRHVPQISTTTHFLFNTSTITNWQYDAAICVRILNQGNIRYGYSQPVTERAAGAKCAKRELDHAEHDGQRIVRSLSIRGINCGELARCSGGSISIRFKLIL